MEFELKYEVYEQRVATVQADSWLEAIMKFNRHEEDDEEVHDRETQYPVEIKNENGDVMEYRKGGFFDFHCFQCGRKVTARRDTDTRREVMDKPVYCPNCKTVSFAEDSEGGDA